MIGKPIRYGLVLLSISAALFASACGSVATPEWAADAQATRTLLAATAAQQTANAPTATATNTPEPTATAVPPTAAPTNTSEATATSVPATETTVPTAEATEAAASGGTADSAAFADAVADADPAAGQAAFQLTRTMPDNSQWACSQCHSVTADQLRIIGPGLWNVSVRALERPGYASAIDYIHESIINPQAFIVPPDSNGVPFPENLMPQHYSDPTIMPPEDLANIVAYLLTLHD
ncbi:MAG: cytochrome c [Anaerolineae bacterium]